MIIYFKNIKLFAIAWLVLISFGIYACTKKMSTVNPSPSAPGSFTYLALGDSYTIGQSVESGKRFPALTEVLLRSYGIKISDPDYIATTGWTTGDLLNAVNATNVKNDYSIVSLLIGVNNQYQGKNLEEYKSQFTTLLQDAIKFAGNDKNRVFVLSIPDYSVTPFARASDTSRIAAQLNEFNAANLAISKSFGVHYLDITPISREAKTNLNLIASDGLHPSGDQYQRWADLLAPMMATVLK